MIFGKETLAKSTLTGKGKKGEAKDQLDPEKVEAIIGTDNHTIIAGISVCLSVCRLSRRLHTWRLYCSGPKG